MIHFKKGIIALIIFSILLAETAAMACSRFTYTGPDNTVVTGRAMDWVEDMKTDLWALPAGISRSGSKENNSVEWTSKFGSVIASGYNIGTTDGINTEGLNANLLYLSTTNYGKPLSERQNISIVNWAQYILDNYATVEEAVRDFGQDKFNMTAQLLPNGDYPTVHLSISDPLGDNAIFEYIDGRLVTYHDKKYKVMTNEPTFDKQLVLNDYWQNLKGSFLPGTDEPEDRFARATYYIENAPKTSDERKSIAAVFSIIRNVSQPITTQALGRPNVSPTIWRSVADLKNKRYYFENTDRPNVFWVDLSKLELHKDAPIKKLPLGNNEVYAGEISQHFITSKPFF